MTMPIKHHDVRAWVTARDLKMVRETLTTLAVPEAVDLLRELDTAERAVAFRALPRDYAAEVFSHLEPHEEAALLRDLTEDETRHVLADMAPDDRTEFLEELPGEVAKRFLGLLSPEDMEEARVLLGYPEESVGRLMTPDFVSVRPAWTVRQALDHVREKGREAETINVIYVTDETGHVEGVLSVRRLLWAEPQTVIAEIMYRTVASLSPTEDREAAVRTAERYDLTVLPVVGADGVMLGIVTIDDLMDVAEGEFTEDMFRLAGINWSEEEVGRSTRILDASLGQVLKLRLPWLLVALAGGLMAGGVVGQFEETLEAIVILAFFIPVVMDMGGNVGTQASTIFVRGFALGHITAENVWPHMWREGRTGLAVGLIVGLVAGVAAWLWQGIFELGIVIFISMIATCTIASLVGFAVPWIAHKAGKDPAAVADPFITTIKDVTGLLIYFGLATWLLGALL
jgi:magnesium transporter